MIYQATPDYYQVGIVVEKGQEIKRRLRSTIHRLEVE